MQLHEDQLFTMYGKAVAESVILRQQLDKLVAELRATKARLEEVEGMLAAEAGGKAKKPEPRQAKE